MMRKRVTLYLEESLIQHAHQIADKSGTAMEKILENWLRQYIDNLPVDSLSNEEIAQLCKYSLNPAAGQELEALLEAHRHNTLSSEENVRLDKLLYDHRKSLIRKAQAIQIASERGLQIH